MAPVIFCTAQWSVFDLWAVVLRGGIQKTRIFWKILKNRRKIYLFFSSSTVIVTEKHICSPKIKFLAHLDGFLIHRNSCSSSYKLSSWTCNTKAPQEPVLLSERKLLWYKLLRVFISTCLNQAVCKVTGLLSKFWRFKYEFKHWMRKKRPKYHIFTH